MAWEIDVSLVAEWMATLDRRSKDLIVAALTVLSAEGPTLGRPLVDTVTGSSFRNMKEIRPGSAGRTEVRILFAFDPHRRALLLVAGDKRGDWSGWYRRAVPRADALFASHLETLNLEGH